MNDKASADEKIPTLSNVNSLKLIEMSRALNHEKLFDLQAFEVSRLFQTFDVFRVLTRALVFHFFSGFQAGDFSRFQNRRLRGNSPRFHVHETV
ncbi:MAG: hypothetical protein LBR53_00230 [Deltaproteobacteria bacterium]|jgi:hypothetical protein|nr:hypothetical protein [Deltaproteobacteria bacterium]